MGPSPDPRGLSRLVTLFEPPTWGWLREVINGLMGHEALGDKGDYREGWGEVPRPPCGAQARTPALSRPVTLFEPPMWRWLPEAINGLLGHEALGTRETIGKVRGRSPDNPVGPRPDTLALSRPVTLFEPQIWRWLPEAINGLLGHEPLGTRETIGKVRG